MSVEIFIVEEQQDGVFYYPYGLNYERFIFRLTHQDAYIWLFHFADELGNPLSKTGQCISGRNLEAFRDELWDRLDVVSDEPMNEPFRRLMSDVERALLRGHTIEFVG